MATFHLSPETGTAYHLCPIKGGIQCKTYKFTEQRDRLTPCPTCVVLGSPNMQLLLLKYRKPEKAAQLVDLDGLGLKQHQKAAQPTWTVEPPLPPLAFNL